MPFAAKWMNTETVILSEVSQKEDTYHMIQHICALRNGTSELIYKQK